MGNPRSHFNNQLFEDLMRKINSLSLISSVLFAAFTMITGCQPAKINAASHEKWQFIVVGDSRGNDMGVNTEILAEIAAQIISTNPDFLLFPGDLVTGSEDSKELRNQLTKWRDTMQPVFDAKIPIYPVRGNHDRGPSKDLLGLSIWNEILAGPYALPSNGPQTENHVTYSVTHKNVFIVALDQYSTKGQHNNQAWLDSQFAKNTAPHVFVLGHEPAFAVKHQDCLDDYPQKRNAFLESITLTGGRTYFCGHDHMYDHISADHDNDPANDIHQFIVGTAGAPLYSHDGQYKGDNAPYEITPIARAAEYGYLIVSVDGLAVTTTWIQRIAPHNYQPQDTWTYTIQPSHSQ
jgi:predicted phosphodiesterase